MYKCPKCGNKEKGVFSITIDDGYCRYKYFLRVKSDMSIINIWEGICEHFGAKYSPDDGELVDNAG